MMRHAPLHSLFTRNKLSNKTAQKFVIFFSGSTAKDTGIQELIAAFREESEKDRQLMKQMFTELIDVLKSNKPT